ncbi:putative PB1 domain protein [Taphrina deformans PYCC 5710]|uniref:PB1 domain protein n=1 Tax=Taphrina deformans (strain PYCC 5710 / ATCC 11124 / CBS 356.35 / IMI 108563 / JCM 9778 / NBRC 8474) TaxID=1097556 RepID=R4XAQ6_TAPDE|nr:putative PB1 domain protein [Taphrina deformans PYCC 5710]|eukprot:CCG81403.1 putative PB1 domain protein [Taphrina deformans PYCC 5710]
MTSSLKQDLEIYIRAVAAFDQQEYELALQQFEIIADTSSKLRFNVALVLATLGRHEEAVRQYQVALGMDRYLAIAYFQQGVSSFLLGRFSDAKDQFDDALLYLRGNEQIDYKQLGLAFKLYSCEVLFNRGLCSLYLKDSAGLRDMQNASKKKQNSTHNAIDEGIKRKGKRCRLFSVPVGLLYRPNESKVRNLATRDYLGKARLVAATDSSDIGTGFRGYEKLQAATISAPSSSANDLSSLQASNRLTALSDKLELVKQRSETDRDLEFRRLDLALERKASMQSTRSRFPLPTRSRTIVSRSKEPLTPASISPRTSNAPSASSRISGSSGFSAVSADSRNGLALAKFSQDTAVQLNGGHNLPTHMHKQDKMIFPNSYDLEFQKTLDSLQQELSVQQRSQASSNSSFSNDSLLALDDKHQFEHESEYLHDYYSLDTPTRTTPSAMPVPMPVIRESEAMRIRVKVCGLEDTRQIMIDSKIEFETFRARLIKKFAWSVLPKLKSKDEDGELILLQDQEDLDECCKAAVLTAQRQSRDIAKVEIWVKS